MVQADRANYAMALVVLCFLCTEQGKVIKTGDHNILISANTSL